MFFACGLQLFSASDFPREFFQSAIIHRGLPDHDNNLMIYNRGKAYRKVAEYQPLYKRFIAYLCEIGERPTPSN